MITLRTLKSKIPYLIVLLTLLGINREVAGQSLKIKKSRKTVNTRAVIVGVSNYLDEDIPDLQFAHTDAQAYAEYLQSPAGGNIPKENIKLYLNELATGANVHQALDWIVKETKKNDQCLIYFSGHGDVETLYEKEPGHFLVHDTPSETYQVNSLRVEDLQQIIKKLSTDIGAKVTVITDACRSGKLAGSEINGSQATAAALLKQFANEIKIMSCQADEYSFEGEQWGGGRGMFSYHMINGLIGLADNNNNDEISLKELQRHLEDSFEEDLFDGKQTPVMIGDRKAIISRADKNAMMLLDVQQEEPILAAANEIEKTNPSDDLLKQFYDALKAKKLLEFDLDNKQDELCAIQLLDQLTATNADDSRMAIAKGDLIAALQNDAHEAINQYLSLDPKEIEKRWNADGSGYDTYAKYLGKAADLLGEYHYIYPQVKAKELYFDVVSKRIDLDREKADSSAYAPLIESLNQALIFQPRSPFINNEMGLVLERMKKYDEAIEQYKKAIEISPTWAMPYNNTGYCYELIKNWNKAIEWYKRSLKQKKNFGTGYQNLYLTLGKIGRFKEAIVYCDKYLELNLLNCPILADKGFLQYKNNEIEEALKSIDDAISCDPNFTRAYYIKADIFRNSKNYSKAIKILELLIPKQNDKSKLYYFIGWNYSLMKHHTKAQEFLKKSIEVNAKSYARIFLAYELLIANKIEACQNELIFILENIDDTDAWVYFYLACSYAMENDLEQFEENMILAIKNGFRDKKEMEESSFLSSIRETEIYIKILKQID